MSKLVRLLRGEINLISKGYCLLHNKRIAKLYVRLFMNKSFTPKDAQLQSLDIVAYNGVNQLVHPSVLHDGKRYIMAISPYPFGMCLYENPCLFTSENGVTYSPVKDASPLDSRNGGMNDYLSDPNVSASDTGYTLLYREFCTGKTTIWRAELNHDLEIVTKPMQLIPQTAKSIIAPCVVSTDGMRYMYYVSINGDKTHFLRTPLENVYTDGEVVALHNAPEGKHIWHTDIAAYQGRLLGLFTFADNFSGAGARTWCAVSNDNGKSFTITAELLLYPNQYKDFLAIYKCALCPCADKLEMIVSCATKKGIWHLYRVADTNIQRLFMEQKND